MTRLSTLLSGPPKPGLYRFNSRAPVERLRLDAERAGWRWFHVDGRAVRDKASFLGALADALAFPEHSGRNWDALEDSLGDLSWQRLEGSRGIVLVIDDADRFARAQPGEWDVARDILSEAVESWRRAGVPMMVLFREARIAAAGLAAA